MGGLILQWGTTGNITAGNSTTVTFPISFPNSCLHAFTGGITATNAGGTASSLTTSSFVAFANSGMNGQKYRWFAIGH